MQQPTESDDEGNPLLQDDEMRELIGSLTAALADIQQLKGKVKSLEGALSTNTSTSESGTGTGSVTLTNKFQTAVANTMNCAPVAYAASPAATDVTMTASKMDDQPSIHDQLSSPQSADSRGSLRSKPLSLMVEQENKTSVTHGLPQSIFKPKVIEKLLTKPSISFEFCADEKEGEPPKNTKSFQSAAFNLMHKPSGNSEKFKPASILNDGKHSKSSRNISIGDSIGDESSSTRSSKWNILKDQNSSFRKAARVVSAFKRKVSFGGKSNEEEFLPNFNEKGRKDNDSDGDVDISSHSFTDRSFGRLGVLSGGDETSLEEDVYSLIILCGFHSKSGALGLASFFFQILLGSFVAYDQIKSGKGSSTFDIPFRVPIVVRLGQFCCIILALCTQSDILTSVRSIVVMGSDSNWDFIVGMEGQKSRRSWFTRIVLPNSMKFCQGILVAFVSFIVVIQTDNIIELLQNFSALMVISEMDNILFQMASFGYFGEELRADTHRLGEVSVVNLSMSFAAHKTSSGLKIVRFIFLIMTLIFLGGWGYVLYFQQIGHYFDTKFPLCKGNYKLAKKHFGDGKCFGGPLNTLGCKFEDGDCISFNFAYPDCKGEALTHLTNVQTELSKSTCLNTDFAILECEFSAGSCCDYSLQRSPAFGDGICNGGKISTKLCALDKEDCYAFSQEFPRCPLEELAEISGSSDVVLGNGICESTIYASPECGYENRDCDVGQIGQDIVLNGVASGTALFFKMRISADGSKVMIGLFRSSESFEYADDDYGRVSVYEFDSTSNSWIRDTSIVGDQIGDRFGFGLSTNIDGERVVVGASRYNQNAGVARVFQFDSSLQAWGQVGEDFSSFGAYTGISVSMDERGSRIAVSASAASSNDLLINGMIKVYDLSSNNLWVQVGNAIAGTKIYEAISFFHMQLSSADGSRIFFNSGYEIYPDYVAIVAYEFDYVLNDWIMLGSPVPNPHPTRNNPAISADGSRFAISSYAVNGSKPGEVHIYELNVVDNVKEWKQMGNALTAQFPKAGDGFGISLSLTADGTLLGVSAVAKECTGSPQFCQTGVVNLYKYKPTNIPGVPFMRVPLKKAIGYGNIAQQEERATDNDLVGRDVLLSRDGSKIFISGFDFVNGNGFVKVYNTDDLFYPECTLSNPEKIGDTFCLVPEPFYTPECGYDGGDCPLPKTIDKYPGCFVSNPKYLEDGECIDAYPYNSEACGYDNGACPLPSPVEGYPNCFVSDPSVIGDGKCDFAWLPYNSFDCGFEGGDCLPN